MSPFENTLVSYNLPGSKIVEAMEWAVSKVDLENGVTGSYINLQFSGIRVKYDYTKPVGSRVVSVRTARCPSTSPWYPTNYIASHRPTSCRRAAMGTPCSPRAQISSKYTTPILTLFCI